VKGTKVNELRTTSPIWIPWAGMAAALAITTTMDATGLSMFGALSLLPLTGLFWFLGKYSRSEMGIVFGSRESYGWAVVYPLVVPGVLTVAAFAFGAVDLTDTEWGKAGRNFALMAATGILGTLLTEEGFFRGWLWAALKKIGRNDRGVLVLTSIAFSLWHLSAVVLDTGFAPPAEQVPVFMVNAALLGVNWGLMRQLSGSVFPAALSHSVWNGLVYTLFGFGEKTGALGIDQSWLFGPEVGVLGLLANALFAWFLWRRAIPGRA
jgi:membrane protease YdiL (CAAX protease family)